MENLGQNTEVTEESVQVDKTKAKFNASEAAAKVGIGKSQSLFTLVLVSVAASTLIASYVLIVGLFMAHRKHADTVSDAVIEAAKELSDITVQHPSTGSVSLCRWRKKGTIFSDLANEQTRSLESVRRTYLKIERIGHSCNIKQFLNLVEQDQKALKQIEADLRSQLEAAIKPPDKTRSQMQPQALGVHSNQGAIYRSVENLIASHYGMLDPSPLALSIQLGYTKSQPGTSKHQALFVKPDIFVEAPPGLAPNMVLLSYTEPEKSRSGATEHKRQTACVYLNPSEDTNWPTAFVLTFPHGVPPFATRLVDYLQDKPWLHKGIWQQAVEGDVPGSGHLAPPVEPMLPEMTPADALATELYHWLKYAGDGIDPNRVASMLREAWTTEPSATSEKSNDDDHSFGTNDDQVNSCIATDNGAREHALTFNTKEGEAGQAALARAFLINNTYSSSLVTKPAMPENAFPLYVDTAGRCSIIGQMQFDQALVRNFFQDLQATNLAARETLATVNRISRTSAQEVTRLEAKMLRERDELSSLNLRNNKLIAEIQTARNAKQETKDLVLQQRITKDQIDELSSVFDSDTTQMRQHQNVERLCLMAQSNAKRAQLNTFDLNGQKLRYCRDGLTRIDPGGYLLGSHLAFRPVTKALQEEDLTQYLDVDDTGAETAIKENTKPDTAANLSPTSPSQWFSKNLALVGTPDEVFPDKATILGAKWWQMLANKSALQHFSPRMLVIDSRHLMAGQSPHANYIEDFNRYPFGNIAVPQSQLIYYCQTAAKTGDKPKIGWSVLARDLVATRGSNEQGRSNYSQSGLPIAAGNSSWYGNTFNGAIAPRLACEFQVRTPLPLTNEFEDSYLQNIQNGQRNALIPLVTPDML
ncbi:MAG TPA: hypothetical protein V6C86_09765 [Oculatellaceae cyanobacterium]